MHVQDMTKDQKLFFSFKTIDGGEVTSKINKNGGVLKYENSPFKCQTLVIFTYQWSKE